MSDNPDLVIEALRLTERYARAGNPTADALGMAAAHMTEWRVRCVGMRVDAAIHLLRSDDLINPYYEQ